MENRVRIKFGEIEFEAQGDIDMIEREREQFFSLLPQAVNTVSQVLPVQQDPTIMQLDMDQSGIFDANDVIEDNEIMKYESLTSLLREKKFANSVELVMGVAYYIDQVKKISPFNTKDIEEELALAREQKPTNINQNINLNIGKSFIIEAKEKKDNKKAFKVSNNGIAWVEDYEPGKKKNNSNIKRKVSTKTVYESKYKSVTREDLNLDNYPEIKKLKTFKEKMMLVMYIFAKENKGEYFTINDIIYVMINIFGEKVTIEQPKGVLRREVMWFNKIKDEENKKSFKYKMLNKGEAFVENILSENEQSIQ